MTSRVFKPGVYTHYKEGAKYLAYNVPTDEETQLPRIIYFALDKPWKDWDRTQEIFMAPAPQDETNKTGQEFKFEFLSNEFPLLYNSDPVKIVEDVHFVFRHLHITDKVKVLDGCSKWFEGTVIGITYGYLILDIGFRHVRLHWRNLKEVYKIMGGIHG